MMSWKSSGVNLIVACGLLAGTSVTKIAFAQEKKDAGTGTAVASGNSAADIPAAKPSDVKSLDAIVAAVYDVISGPPGERDWSRFNSLFTKDARLIAVRTPKDGGKPSLVVM